MNILLLPITANRALFSSQSTKSDITLLQSMTVFSLKLYLQSEVTGRGYDIPRDLGTK